jgi:hypothetical protein
VRQLFFTRSFGLLDRKKLRKYYLSETSFRSEVIKNPLNIRASFESFQAFNRSPTARFPPLAKSVYKKRLVGSGGCSQGFAGDGEFRGRHNYFMRIRTAIGTMRMSIDDGMMTYYWRALRLCRWGRLVSPTSVFA